MNETLHAVLVDLAIAVLVIFTPLLTAVMTKLAKRAGDILGVKLSDSEQAQLNQAVTDAVAYADEWARQVVKGGGTTPPSTDKLTTAIGAARMFAGKAAERIGDEVMAKLLEAKLAQLRTASALAADDERPTLPPVKVSDD